MQREFVTSRLPLNVEGVELDIATMHREGRLDPVLFLHGFGSTKEDYADIVRYEAFAGHPFLAYDAPGCGETRCSDLSRISIPFLARLWPFWNVPSSTTSTLSAIRWAA